MLTKKTILLFFCCIRKDLGYNFNVYLIYLDTVRSIWKTKVCFLFVWFFIYCLIFLFVFLDLTFV